MFVYFVQGLRFLVDFGFETGVFVVGFGALLRKRKEVEVRWIVQLVWPKMAKFLDDLALNDIFGGKSRHLVANQLVGDTSVHELFFSFLVKLVALLDAAHVHVQVVQFLGLSTDSKVWVQKHQ